MSFRLFGSLVVGFFLLQILDFALTWLLLDGSHRGDVYESNPLAQEILNQAGWLGLAAFKLAVTAVALTAGLFVARRRPSTGLKLLVVLCAVMLAVNVYSGTLLASPDSHRLEEAEARDRAADLTRQVALCHEYADRRDRICDDLLDGTIDSEKALTHLGALVDDFAPHLRLPSVGRLPEASRAEEVAAYLAFHAQRRARDRGLNEPEVLTGLRRAEASAHHDVSIPAWLRSD